MQYVSRKMMVLLSALALGRGLGFAAPMEAIEWRIPEYSLTARSMSIREAVEAFAVAEGVAIMMSDRVDGVISGDFVKTPAGEFIRRIVSMYNLVEYYDGSTLWLYGATENVTTMQDLRYMKAAEVAAMLKELGVEDPRFPLKTASNDELILVSGPPRYVQLVIEMIARADKLREVRTFTEVETRIFPLKHTWADDVSFNSGSTDVSGESSTTIKGMATLLRELMGVSDSVSKVREGETNSLASADAKAEEAASRGFRAVVQPENRLNAVVVRDITTKMPQYEKLISELDVPQKLVDIGITTIELNREDSLDWQLSLKASAQSSHGATQGGVGQNAGNLFDVDGIGGQGLAGAFTYLDKHVNLGASISALRTKGKARNISRTSLLTLNNMAAEISDTQSYHAKVVGTEVASLESVTAGTKLSIKPRFVPPAGTNVTGQVWLTMELEDGGFESVAVDDMPMTRSTKIETQAAVFEGDSILLAGYFRDVQEDAAWGIPWLRDIPWIGWIFGGVSKVNNTYQRMFVLTPHMIDLMDYTSPTNSLVLKQALIQRNTEEAEMIEDNVDRDDLARKEREARSAEKREIRHEQFDETYNRNEAERGFSREKRHDERKVDHDEWLEDFDSRREEYRRSKEAKEAAAAAAEIDAVETDAAEAKEPETK